ncbi:MAG: S49 family peptidase, partial [Allorhizobium sp.]
EIKTRYGKDARLELIGAQKGLFGRRAPGIGAFAAPDQIAVQAVAGLAETLEEKALWGRYGL